MRKSIAVPRSQNYVMESTRRKIDSIIRIFLKPSYRILFHISKLIIWSNEGQIYISIIIIIYLYLYNYIIIFIFYMCIYV